MSKKLLQSIKRGDAEGIHDSVRDGADINGTDKKGKPLLLLAIEEGDPDVIAAMIKQNVNAFEKDKRSQYTALITAIIEDQPALKKDKMDINATDKDGQTALHWALTLPMPEVALSILKSQKHSADCTIAEKIRGRYPIHEAAARGNTVIVDLLLKKGGQESLLDSKGGCGLMAAVLSGQSAMAKKLAARGFDVNLANKQGVSDDQSCLVLVDTNAYCKEQALHIAARDGDLECVKVLVAAGADAKAVTTAGHTAYDLAAAGEWSNSADPEPILKVLRDVGGAAVKPVVANPSGSGGGGEEGGEGDADSTSNEAGGDGGKPIDVAAIMAAKKSKKKKEKAEKASGSTKDGPSMGAYVAVGLLTMLFVVPFLVIASEYLM